MSGIEQRFWSAYCRHGHERTPENTRIDSRGARVCRLCDRIATRKSKAKRLSNTIQ